MAKWQTRQGELKADLAQIATVSTAAPTSAGVNAIPIGSKQPVASSSVHSSLHGPKRFRLQDFVDTSIHYAMLSRLQMSHKKPRPRRVQPLTTVMLARWHAFFVNGNSKLWIF